MSEPRFTPGPWQFAFGNLSDHSEDGDANGFTILMAGARTAKAPCNETPGAGAARQGRRLVIHEIRYAEDVFPEDAGRDEAEANAHLIAAAPEMFGALEAARDALRMILGAGGAFDLPHVLAEVEKALATAAGEPTPSMDEPK